MPEPTTAETVDASTVQDASSVKDASAADAADVSIPAACGIVLAGPKWAPACQSWAEAHCCDGLQVCAKDNVCSSWVNCIDSCAGSSDPNCTKKCGPIRIAFQTAYNCMFDIADGSPKLPADCVWP